MRPNAKPVKKYTQSAVDSLTGKKLDKGSNAAGNAPTIATITRQRRGHMCKTGKAVPWSRASFLNLPSVSEQRPMAINCLYITLANCHPMAKNLTVAMIAMSLLLSR